MNFFPQLTDKVAKASNQVRNSSAFDKVADMITKGIQSVPPLPPISLPDLSMPSAEQVLDKAWQGLSSIPVIGWFTNPYALPLILMAVVAVVGLRVWMWYWASTVPAKWLTPRELQQRLKATNKVALSEVLEEIPLGQLKEIHQETERILRQYDGIEHLRVAKEVDCADTTHSQE
jgi:hypothetical protein